MSLYSEFLRSFNGFSEYRVIRVLRLFVSFCTDFLSCNCTVEGRNIFKIVQLKQISRGWIFFVTACFVTRATYHTNIFSHFHGLFTDRSDSLFALNDREAKKLTSSEGILGLSYWFNHEYSSFSLCHNLSAR